MAVVGLGALCDLAATGNDDPRGHRFDVSEFAVLDNGDRIVLHRERGWSAATNAADIWSSETVETLTRSVLDVVLPDDAETTGDEHPWEWLAELVRLHGIDATADALRHVPYAVVFTERVLARLPTTP